ncbi:STAS-like domain-containing protein [Paraburkholderia sp. Clong3]|uniref:STAS-like domain-containing protein n=1 Tax=Paraburkholderia sp. Clong3 TaxID=2991061 RepID=UPI003D225EC5
MISKVREKGELVRRFILEHIESHNGDIAALAAEQFGITRQAVNKHLTRLRDQGTVTKDGTGRASSYKLVQLFEQTFSYTITESLAEDVVWRQDIKDTISPLPDNVVNIWHHGFTEMFNNAIDHSGGTTIAVKITKTAISTEVVISDDGVGIFKKIQTEFGLLDERHAIFELAKGKLTTDPRNHSGEGIFFTSRMYDKFEILSGGLYFNHERGKPEDWLLERSKAHPGTAVFMELNNHTARTTRKVFDEFTESDDYTFDKTIVPVNLARYGADELVSRSQAKRLLARVELFKHVIFDFKDVDSIGQAFADQIFRVFAKEHPEIELVPLNTNAEVAKMVKRAQAAKDGE